MVVCSPHPPRMNAVTTRCVLASTGRPCVLPVSRGADRFSGRSVSLSTLHAAPRLAAPRARLRRQLLDASPEHLIVPVRVADLELQPVHGRRRRHVRCHGVVSRPPPHLLGHVGVAVVVGEAGARLGGAGRRRRGRGGDRHPGQRRLHLPAGRGEAALVGGTRDLSGVGHYFSRLGDAIVHPLRACGSSN